MSTTELDDGAGNQAAHPWIGRAAICLAVGVMLTMFVGVLLRSIYVDERANLNYLWLIAQGERPYQDFWCTYPVAGYAFFLPIFQRLPEQAGVIIVLRLYSVVFVLGGLAAVCFWSRKLSGCWWLPLLPALPLVNDEGVIQDGMARVLKEYRLDAPAMFLAFLSIALLFGDSRGWKRVVSVACAVVSLAVMPKYLYILAACHAFDWLGRWFGRRWSARIVWETLAGGLIGFGAAWGMTVAMHASLQDTWRWAFLLQARFQALVAASGDFPEGFFCSRVLPFAQNGWWASALLAAGIGGFFIWVKRHGWGNQRAWIGYGLLTGVVVTVWRTVLPFNQYLPEVFLPLLFFFPFIWSPGPPSRRGILVQGLLLILMAVTLVGVVHRQAQDLVTSSLFLDITQEDVLLAAVPREEPVLGNFPVIFRKSETYVTYDEIWGNPRGFSSLVQDDPDVAWEFSPDRLEEVLQQYPPAIIDFTISYPPGWLPVVQEYLQQNEQYYQQLNFMPSSDIRNDEIYIRNDLVQ